MRSTKAIINLKAIQQNLLVVRRLTPDAKVMAIVKANAYGHGIVQVARALIDVEQGGVNAIAVACMEEAIRLRESGVKVPIVLLEGFFSEKELALAVENNLEIVVHQEAQLNAIESMFFAGNFNQVQLKLWLKLDSGMNRLGFTKTSYQNAYDRLAVLPCVHSINLMSHFACADDITNPQNQRQLNLFSRVTKGLSGEKSMANSAGVVAWPESHYDWVRPGIILYGGSPMLGLQGDSHHLVPAMTLKSQLFAIRTVKAGDTVGYGAVWVAKRATRIGIIAIGYGDGYPRHAKEGTPVWIRGKTHPLVGRVSMDMITVDLGTRDLFEIGDEAILWGEKLPVETIAKYSDTICYTLLCGVTSRVNFEWEG